MVDENTIEVEELRAGTKCKVWGKKGSEENAKVMYYSYSDKTGSNYFAPNKTLAVNGSVAFSRLMYGHKLTNYKNYKIIVD